MSPEALKGVIDALREKVETHRESARSTAYAETRERHRGAMVATIEAIEMIEAASKAVAS